MSESDGIMNRIPFLLDSYKAMQTWTKCEDPNMMIFKYEELFGKDQYQHFERLFKHLEIECACALCCWH